MYAKPRSLLTSCALTLTFVSACTPALPHDFSDNLGALPRTATTTTVTPQGEAHYSVESLANADHTGSIHVIAHVDIDDSKMTN